MKKIEVKGLTSKDVTEIITRLKKANRKQLKDIALEVDTLAAQSKIY